MKSIKKEGFDKLQKAFTVAYRKKEKPEVGALFQTRVMGHIRSLDPLHTKTMFFEVFQRFLWRLVPVTIVLILLLGAAITRIDVVSDYELTKIFLEDPEDFSLLALNDTR